MSEPTNKERAEKLSKAIFKIQDEYLANDYTIEKTTEKVNKKIEQAFQAKEKEVLERVEVKELRNFINHNYTCPSLVSGFPNQCDCGFTKVKRNFDTPVGGKDE